LVRFAYILKVKRSKRLGDEELEKLLVLEAERLRRKYPQPYEETHPVAWFRSDSQFGFENVPKAEVENLKKVFAPFIARMVRIKRHEHLWVPVGFDSEWVWLVCGEWDCDATLQLAAARSSALLNKVLLPFARSTLDNSSLYNEKARGCVLKLFEHRWWLVEKAIRRLRRQLAVENALGCLKAKEIEKNLKALGLVKLLFGKTEN
jgi:hypothetical protein